MDKQLKTTIRYFESRSQNLLLFCFMILIIGRDYMKKTYHTHMHSNDKKNITILFNLKLINQN